MTDAERKRLVSFLRSKQCGPCRRDDAKGDHAGCVEAEELTETWNAADGPTMAKLAIVG